MYQEQCESRCSFLARGLATRSPTFSLIDLLPLLLCNTDYGNGERRTAILAMSYFLCLVFPPFDELLKRLTHPIIGMYRRHGTLRFQATTQGRHSTKGLGACL